MAKQFTLAKWRILIYCGAEHINCPLGSSAEEVFENAKSGKIAVARHSLPAISPDPFYASMFTHEDFQLLRCKKLVVEAIGASMQKCRKDVLTSDRTLLILSSTKGDIDGIEDESPAATLSGLLADVCEELKFHGKGIVVSNACISGVLGVISAADLIHSGEYDNAIVCGVDLVTRFTVRGFQSLFALEDGYCKPYDKSRKGINLGEGVSCMVLSRDADVFEKPFVYLAGACANDANHISGPSRTGEGLHRAIERSFEAADIRRDSVDQISAHGTATVYNDEMESIAFERSGLANVPLHSYKGYFGHTLGAAGVIELSLLFQSVRNAVILPSAGFEEEGTSQSIAVTRSLIERSSTNILKTASGFGGCNAAALFRYDHN